MKKSSFRNNSAFCTTFAFGLFYVHRVPAPSPVMKCSLQSLLSSLNDGVMAELINDVIVAIKYQL